jgi:hypothetical protein
MMRCFVGLFVLIVTGPAFGDLALTDGAISSQAQGDGFDTDRRTLVANNPSTWSGSFASEAGAPGTIRQSTSNNTYRFTADAGLTVSGSHRRGALGSTGGAAVSSVFLEFQALTDTPYHLAGRYTIDDADPRGSVEMSARLVDLSTGSTLFTHTGGRLFVDTLVLGDPTRSAGSLDGQLVSRHGYRLEFDVRMESRTSTNGVDFDGASGTFNLLLAPALAGDANFDARVDGSDFALLAANFGRTGRDWGRGDFNGDSRVDGSDFALLAGNFGRTSGQTRALTLAVPEPAMLWLMPVTGLLLGRCRERHPRQPHAEHQSCCYTRLNRSGTGSRVAVDAVR